MHGISCRDNSSFHASSEKVSVHNKHLTVYRSNMEQSTVNSRMQIALKVTGIASFDPRGVGADFLKSRQRRFRQSNFESYQERKFVKIKIKI